jgi:hypothetical protein
MIVPGNCCDSGPGENAKNEAFGRKVTFAVKRSPPLDFALAIETLPELD